MNRQSPSARFRRETPYVLCHSICYFCRVTGSCYVSILSIQFKSCMNFVDSKLASCVIFVDTEFVACVIFVRMEFISYIIFVEMEFAACIIFVVIRSLITAIPYKGAFE